MHLKKFLCCLPLIWGVVFVGLTYGTTYFILGTTGWQMVIEGEYDENLIWFFRKLSIRLCVSLVSVIMYFMAIINFLLAYGAYTSNHQLVGTWLLVHFLTFMLTLYSALVHPYLLLHTVSTGYAMFVVKSFYETLIPASESDDEYSSEDDL